MFILQHDTIGQNITKIVAGGVLTFCHSLLYISLSCIYLVYISDSLLYITRIYERHIVSILLPAAADCAAATHHIIPASGS